MKILSSYPDSHEAQSALADFLEVSTRAGCGGTIYLGITREASKIFSYSFRICLTNCERCYNEKVKY